MAKMVHLIILVMGMLYCQVDGNWLDGAKDSMTASAKHLIEDGSEVMQTLEAKIRDKRSPKDGPTMFGLNLDACADLSDEYGEAEKLLVAGATLYYDASNDYHDITNCFSSPSGYECWTQVVEKLPTFLEKYKPLTACYVNNVVYSIEMLDYYFYLCIGSDPQLPKAPPKTYEECVKDIE